MVTFWSAALISYAPVLSTATHRCKAGGLKITVDICCFQENLRVLLYLGGKAVLEELKKLAFL